MLRDKVIVVILVFGLSVISLYAKDAIKEQINSSLEAKIDSLVLIKGKVPTDGPGCAVAVLKDGKLVFKKGYGIANLDYGVPITPSTAFNIASVSKQFTAACVLLLSRDGKLSLDDEVHKYITELPDYGHPITINNLIHHTSGIRSSDILKVFSGRRDEDFNDNKETLNLIIRNRELNFIPGEEFSYSNSGYLLLAEIVKRVSGKSLAEFAEDIIFQPLGMSSTAYHDDRHEIIKNRAAGYANSDKGWKLKDSINDTEIGANNLFSTVEDLVKWEQNFFDQKVGGVGFTEQMQTCGLLNSGYATNYAFGLFIGESKGLKTVNHQGGAGGFTAFILRFPEQRFSAICLSNSENRDLPGDICWDIANIFLANAYKKQLEKVVNADTILNNKEPRIVSIEPFLLDSYVGKYRMDKAGVVLTITKKGGCLTTQFPGQPAPFEIVPESDSVFFLKEAPSVKHTFRKGSDCKIDQIVIRDINDEGEDVLNRIEDQLFSIEQLKDFIGDYYCEDMGVTYTVLLKENELFIRTPIVDESFCEKWGLTGQDTLTYCGGDTFSFSVMPVNFKRDNTGKVIAFTLDTGRVNNLLFRKDTARIGRMH
jgi:CubicO group peptidase (beta-lactamase class C family)